MQGALRVREILPEVNLIFLTPPTVDELERRLVSRGTETAEVIRERMARAKEESAYMKEYDYVVINDDLDECVENVHQLIRSLHYKREQQEGFIQKIKQEFEKR